METEKFQKYERAVKHVRELKEFYQHAAVFVGFLMVLFLFKQRIIDFILAKTEHTGSGFLDWIHININLIPFIWGASVAIHGLYVYRLKFTFFKDWENRKIQELMHEEEQKNTVDWK